MNNNDDKGMDLKNPVVNQRNENCQIFTGPISGCVFAMPGATVNQTATQHVQQEADAELDPQLIEKLMPIFYNNEKEVRDFLGKIKGMRSKDITALVNRLAGNRVIADLSRKRKLWKILHDAGLYTASETNWNKLVE